MKLYVLRNLCQFSFFLVVFLPTLALAGNGVIGDKVWHDANENGKQDSGEAGVPDINVDLEIYNGPSYPSTTDLEDPANWDFFANTTTNGIGSYHFTGLEATYYRLRFGLKAGYMFTGKNQVHFVQDNDADADGYTAAFYLDAGLTNNTLDAGMYEDPSLPVTLTSFIASKGENNSVTLNWSTTEEVNSDYFSVQVSSDARSWDEIGKVASTGNHVGLLNYEFVQSQPASGTNYYRLKMVDFDGSFAYSQIRQISLENRAEISKVISYPNPTSEQLFVKTAPGYKIVEAKIFDLSGREVLGAKPSEIESGINVKGLHRGMYIMSIYPESGKIESHKVMIVK